METRELLVSTSRNEQQISAHVWDPLTGNLLHLYKNGGTVAPKTLNFLHYDYLLTSEEKKPLTHLWPLNSQELDKKLTTVLPDKITVMTLCPKSTYLAAGIGPKLYIWLLPAGKLLTVQKKNFQPITCIQFTNCGRYLVLAGEDGLLVAYKLNNLVSLHYNLQAQTDGQVEPLYIKNDHSLPITDLHVGNFGHKSRLASVSTDNTCKVYSLLRGTLLLNLVFEGPLSAVTFDNPCWNLFVGQTSGLVQQFVLKDPPREVQHHAGGELVFRGHSAKVTCLDLGGGGSLVSGSDDGLVMIWELQSRQVLRTIEAKGAVTNVRWILRHEGFFGECLRKGVVRNLERELVESEDFEVGVLQDFEVESSDGENEEEVGLKEENLRLRAANRELYEGALRISRKYNDF